MNKTRHILAALTMFAAVQTHAIEHVTAIRAPIPSMKNQLQTGRFDIDLDVHPSWMHHITELNYKKGTITLENGSQWRLGMMYSNVLRQWQVGDQVTLSWYENTIFLDTQIKNNTKQGYAWSNMVRSPQPGAAGFLYITKIPNRMILELSDGTQVKTQYPHMFRDLREGDIVITLYGKGTGSKTRYSLWDVSCGLVTYDLSVS